MHILKVNASIDPELIITS